MIELDRYTYSAQNRGEIETIKTEELIPPIAPITADQIADILNDANDTYDVIKGPSGKKFEVAVFNPDASDILRARPSTSFSSLYKNPGNAIETAVIAAAIPEEQHLYIGSFGNRPSSCLSLKDLLYVARSGRYTRGSGNDEDPYRPLGSLEDMAEALDKAGLLPNAFGAEVEGGRTALGLMTALGRGSVRYAVLNGLDGISATKGYASKKLSEDFKSRGERRRKLDPQPFDITPGNIRLAKDAMPAVYRGLGRVAHYAPFYPDDLAQKLLTTIGCTRHDDRRDLGQHAVYNDILAAMEQQPETRMTLNFMRQSAIHNETQCVEFGEDIARELSKSDRNNAKRISVQISEGTLDQRTDDPVVHAGIERYSLKYSQ